MRLIAILLIGLLFSPALIAQGTPKTVANDLLAADRAFSKAAAGKTPVEAISSMFAADVINPIPGGFAEGPAKAIEALRAYPDNLSGEVEWKPVRAGVSGDGLHGFTWGYMTLTKPDKTKLPLKYLAYWVKGTEGWRVVSYKRRIRAEGNVSTSSMAPSLPDQLVPPVTDPAVIAKHRDSLAAAEKNFSDEAQKIGIGPAFEKNGSVDAMNMGGPNDPAFVIGNVAIGQSVGGGSPAGASPVSWAADHKTIVASSGDFGITFGFIKPNAPGADGKPAPSTPFTTIWRRANAAGVWKYIAE